jgi:hypothetical protein
MTYFFVITSYEAAGNESFRSNEVSKSIFKGIAAVDMGLD